MNNAEIITAGLFKTVFSHKKYKYFKYSLSQILLHKTRLKQPGYITSSKYISIHRECTSTYYLHTHTPMKHN